MALPEHNTADMVGLLLAAGFSRRFGTLNKLHHRLAEGDTVAARAARTLITALPRAVAVVREDDTLLAQTMTALGYRVALCDATQQTMSDSLKLGVLTAQTSFPEIKGLVIALADMPFIQAATIQSIAQALSQTQIVQPEYQGQPGHPVGFSHAFIPALMTITGDQGARQVVRAHQAEVQRLVCQDAGILRDIDTPADLP